MNDANLLYSALLEHDIPRPPHYKSSGFMRWGSGYWAKEKGEGYIFGDYVSGLSDSIFPKMERKLTPSEIQARRKAIVEAEKEEREERERLYQSTAEKALKIWQCLQPAQAEHTYLQKKQVLSYGIKQDEDKLIIPLRDTNNKIWSLQYIDNEGNKRFLSGGKTKGCYFSIGKPDKEIIICEGYATGASIHQATNKAVAVAFNVGNLEPVVKALKNKYPQYEIWIAGDNDIKENALNVGKDEAERISKNYNARLFIPELKDKSKCDFNDVATKEGLEAVKSFFDLKVMSRGNEQDNAKVTLRVENLETENNSKVTARVKIENSNIPSGFCLNDKGLYYIGGDTDEPLYVSSKIEVSSLTRDENSSNWGKLVKFNDLDGVEKQIALPCSLFAGDCRELKEWLLTEGLQINNSKKLIEYLKLSTPTARALCRNKTGWYNNVFIFPDSIIGNNNEDVHFQSDNKNNEYKTKGSLEDWKNNISAYCRGNSRLMFAVSTAFASCLLPLADIENGGFHFVGNSSCGKSTILKVSASVWGGVDYLKTWRATDNGLEGVASLHNDSLLILDELGQVDPAKAGDIAYMLGNGNGKVRSNRNGYSKKAYDWRLLFLSSGEKDLNDCAIESHKKVKAGQEIRLLNIPATPINGYGVFEELHTLGGGKELSEHLTREVKSNYGLASREFIRNITNENQEELKQHIKQFMREITNKYLPDTADNQAKRAFNRFALVAYAGEYATANNITGWEKGEAIEASIKCFNAWSDARGGLGNQEDKAILEQIKYFFEQNAQSRFYDLDKDDKSKVINMVGYKWQEEQETKYAVLRTCFNQDLCKGFNSAQAKDVLFNAEILEAKEPKQLTRGESKGKRAYVFTSKIWSI